MNELPFQAWIGSIALAFLEKIEYEDCVREKMLVKKSLACLDGFYSEARVGLSPQFEIWGSQLLWLQLSEIGFSLLWYHLYVIKKKCT